MLRSFYQRPVSSFEGASGASPYEFPADVSTGQHERYRLRDREATLLTEADQLLQWLTEALGDPTVDGPQFVAGIERLSEVLVQLRTSGRLPRQRSGKPPSNED